MGFARSPDDPLYLFEKIRGIAQEGLAYCNDPYDRERYEELLAMSASAYGRLFNTPVEIVVDLFRKDLGVVTPKVGVEAAIFSESGEILLIRRSDDGLFGLPGGWARLCETAKQATAREVFEETGLQVAVHDIIDVFSCLPGEYQRLHTSFFLLFYCTIEGGQLLSSRESLEVGYAVFDEITQWHKDHQEHARVAVDFFSKLCKAN